MHYYNTAGSIKLIWNLNWNKKKIENAWDNLLNTIHKMSAQGRHIIKLNCLGI